MAEALLELRGTSHATTQLASIAEYISVDSPTNRRSGRHRGIKSGRQRMRAIPTIALLSLVGCNAVDSICPASVPAISAVVVDSLTGASLTTVTQIVGVHAGIAETADVIVLRDSSTVQLLGFASGQYDLMATASGYVSWQSSVNVPHEGCGAKTVQLTIRLHPAS